MERDCVGEEAGCSCEEGCDVRFLPFQGPLFEEELSVLGGDKRMVYYVCLLRCTDFVTRTDRKEYGKGRVRVT